MKILRANLNHLDVVANLFDQYRQFYEQEADFTGCRTYINQRMTNDESVIFIAQTDEGETIGFTQLYPSFCSVAMKKIIYLYDLFVVPSARRTGVGATLILVAKEYAQTYGADRLTLETGVDNSAAQALYESLGYERDSDFYTYHLQFGS